MTDFVGDVTLRVSSWNVLATAYLDVSYYPQLTQTPDSDERTGQVAEVVAELGRSSDVICLQEVEQDVARAATEQLASAFATPAESPTIGRGPSWRGPIRRLPRACRTGPVPPMGRHATGGPGTPAPTRSRRSPHPR